ncbi:MAG: mraZ [Verrucomicrobiota bacterium]
MSLPGPHVYSGGFDRTLDEKNRITIPSLWRWPHSDTDSFLAMPHPDGYITVLPPVRLAALLADVSLRKVSDSEAQAVLAKIFSQSLAFTFDKQGRFGLTTELRDYAGIKAKGDVRLMGMGDTFNILTPASRMQLERKTEGEQYGEMMRRIGL